MPGELWFTEHSVYLEYHFLSPRKGYQGRRAWVAIDGVILHTVLHTEYSPLLSGLAIVQLQKYNVCCSNLISHNALKQHLPVHRAFHVTWPPSVYCTRQAK